jgi:hypothetical protein
VGPKPRQSSGFISPHQAAVADDIGGEDRREPSLDPVSAHRLAAPKRAVQLRVRPNPLRRESREGSDSLQEGNVVWYNPDSKIYFPPGSQFFGKTKNGGYTCKAFADKEGYRATKGN